MNLSIHHIVYNIQYCLVHVGIVPYTVTMKYSYPSKVLEKDHY